MKRTFFLTAFLLVGALAQAQIPTAGNVFIGYSVSGGNVFAPGLGTARGLSPNTTLNGWEGSLEGKLLRWVGIVADLSGQYGSHDLAICTNCINTVTVSVSARRYTFLFGPRVSVPIGKFTPFAHAMVGAGHVSDTGGGISNSDTSLATAFGGGLDYKLIKGLAWRFQGDELHTSFFGAGQNHFRFSTGIVFRF